MSILGRKWHLFEQESGLSRELSEQFDISNVTSQVLINRGLKTKEEVQDFLNPKLGSLRDPFEIPDMKQAVARVLEARARGEKVTVYGDYDADGVTGTTIILLGLKNIGVEASYYIPHRYDEGYGMNEEAVKKLAFEGCKLIITVDCGVSNCKEVRAAKELGLDVIITDHHNIPDTLPGAIAVVNPKRIKGRHPSKDLAGAGVAFKFIWALYRMAGISDSVPVKEFLDLAALGTVADVVPLVGENRAITVSGIKVLNDKKRVGVKHLFDAAGISGKATTRNISFMLAPRLNAPGRLEHARLSVNLLLEDDPLKARMIAGEINRINTERQQIGGLIGDDAYSRLRDVDVKQLIVLSGKGWHPGVIGIVASKIAEKFNRPTILISHDKDSCRGSARSIEGFDVYGLLASCRDLFSDFGGHKDAAGFEMPAGNIQALEDRLSKEIAGTIKIENLVPRTKIDAEIDPGMISLKLASELEKLEPFGSGNRSPVFVSKKLRITGKKKVGSKGNHLKLKLSNGKSVIDSIGFGMGAIDEKLIKDQDFDVAYNLSLNRWDGFEIPQMELVDLRRSKG